MIKVKFIEEEYQDNFLSNKKYIYTSFKSIEELDTFLRFLIIQNKINNQNSYITYKYLIRRNDNRLFYINDLYYFKYLHLKDFVKEF